MRKSSRRAGSAASSEERMLWSQAKLVNNIRKNIRRDYGGKDPREIAFKRLVDGLLDHGSGWYAAQVITGLSDKNREAIIDVLLDADRFTVRGIRTRTKADLDELMRRASANDKE